METSDYSRTASEHSRDFFLIVAPKEEKVTLTFGMFAGNQWDVPDDDCYKIIDETI